MSHFTLYDLPSKAGVAWSYNPWKTRLAFNFKRLNYTTEWVEYPDVEPTLKPHVPPNTSTDKNVAAYSIPTARFPDSRYIMDSKAIALRLEKEHPEPSMHLDSPVLTEIETLLSEVARQIRGVCVPKVPSILNELSIVYFERTRKERLGKTLAEFGAQEGGEEAWMAAVPKIKELGEVVKKNGGPFVLGDNPSYADFVIVSYLQFLKVLDQEFYDKIVGIEPTFGKLYEACEPWLKRNSY